MPIRPLLRTLSNHSLITLTAVSLALSLSACGSNPHQPGKPKQAPVKTQPEAISASKLLEMANQAPSPERESLVLQAAQVYITNQKFNRARDLLVDMDTDILADQAYIKHTDLLSAIALHEGSNFLAHGILTKPRLEQQWQNMEPFMEVSLREKRAQVFALLGEAQESVNERIQLAGLIDNKTQQQKNQDALWQN